MSQDSAVTGVDWDTLEVTPDWLPIARICRRIAESEPAMTIAVATRIKNELPMYADTAGVPAEDLLTAVARNIEMMLVATAQQRGPTPAELVAEKELGRRRAAQGAPIDALLQALFVGYRELWSELIRCAGDDGPEARDLLLTSAATVWQWVHELTNAIGESYREHSRERTAQIDALREQLFQALVGGDVDSEQVATTARLLGFDIRTAFTAVAFGIEGDEHQREDVVDLVTASTRGGSGTGHAQVRGGTLYLLAQGGDLKALAARIDQLRPAVPVGVGMSRIGLRGAHLSLGDADRAMALSAKRGQRVEFADDWLAASLLPTMPRLTELLAPAADRHVTESQLAETVLAFSESFSQSAAARSLGVHVNTVAYRLARWHELTGWDPRTFDGLARSMVGLELVGGATPS